MSAPMVSKINQGGIQGDELLNPCDGLRLLIRSSGLG